MFKLSSDISQAPTPQECLRTSLFLRGLALAKLSLQVGSKAFGPEEQMRERLTEQAQLIARELGQLKGCVMKVGQMLSVYGEQFLPPEVNTILKSLQSKAPPLEWHAIDAVLRRELSPEALSNLEIEETAFACASLGQVHRARVKSTGHMIALKVQYPGVARAVESDLKALKSMVSLAQLLPQVPQLNAGVCEIQEMLRQELDYRLEAKQTMEFQKRLLGDDRYLVPQVHEEFSSERVLATDFIEGFRIDSDDAKALSQERRNRLALSALDLYFNEIFSWKSVQTDPHFGNFLLACNEKEDRLALFDFGAVRQFDGCFVSNYRKLTQASMSKDRDGVCTAALAMGFLRDDDTEELIQEFFEFCVLIIEPFCVEAANQDARHLFENGNYDWSKSDLPSRLSAQLGRVIAAHKFRPPPREMIFLDRKTTGLFIMMATLGARIDARPLVERHLSE